MPFRQWEDPESRLRLRTRRLEKLLSQMHFCSDAQMPRSIKTALDIMVLTIQGLSPLPIRGLSPVPGVEHMGTVPTANRQAW